MNETDGMKALMAGFFTCSAIIAWREIKYIGRVPIPGAFVAPMVAYGLLGLLAHFLSPRLAATIGFGLVVGLLYYELSPQGDSGGTGFTTGFQKIEWSTPDSWNWSWGEVGAGVGPEIGSVRPF